MDQASSKQITTSLDLQKRGFFHPQRMDPGTTVICEKGILWLTQSNDYSDYMLRAGDRLVLQKPSSLLIEALSSARVSIQHTN